MNIIYHPKIVLISFFLISFIVYLFYLFGEKGYRKGSSQTIPYFSGEMPPKNIKLQGVYWGFFKDLEKLYTLLAGTRKENTNDYIFFFISGLVILLLIICII